MIFSSKPITVQCPAVSSTLELYYMLCIQQVLFYLGHFAVFSLSYPQQVLKNVLEISEYGAIQKFSRIYFEVPDIFERLLEPLRGHSTRKQQG